MKRFNAFAVTSMVFAFTVMCGGVASALPEVWQASSNVLHISRFGLDGTSLGSVPTSSTNNALAVVGNEVWAGKENTYGINRYDFLGNFLGDLDTTGGVTALAVVPEPNSALLLGLGLSALAVRRENR